MTMRITDSYLSSILVRDLNLSLGRMLEQQITAGSLRRVNSYADDPRAVGTIQRYNDMIANNEQYLSNVERDRLIVDATDTALQNISDVLADVRVIALRESSAIATDQSQETTVIEVDNLMNRLMDVLNTQIEGNYIFSGHQTDTMPFVRSGESVLYEGDDNIITSRTGPSMRMPVNIPGNVFMGTQSAILGGTANLQPRLDAATLLSDINAGGGWTAGTISLNDGLGNNYLVDLSSCTTIGDVMATINTDTGGVITASLAADGSGLELAGTGPILVDDWEDGSAATDLGLIQDSDGGILTGRDIRTAAAGTTNLADIESLAGSLPLGQIEVIYLDTTYVVDFAGAATLDDLVATFNAAVPGMELAIRDSSIALISGSPDSFTVANADATDTASLLGITGSGTPVRLFGLLEDLKAALEAGDKEAIRGSVNELTALENTVYKLMMTTGGRQADLDWAEEVLRARDERLRSNLSLEYDADVAEVASQLSRAEASYQASLLVTSKLFEINLMNYL